MNRKMCRGSASGECQFAKQERVVSECRRLRVPHVCTWGCSHQGYMCRCVDLPLEYLMKEILDEENV